MKIEKAQPAFQPVVITLESPEEVAAMGLMAGVWSQDTLQKALANSGFYVTEPNYHQRIFKECYKGRLNSGFVLKERHNA